jgi:hypothetical protein
MAAPLGFKTFNTGDVLSAADTNGYLMQGIWVFADATARDAAVTSPQEGNSCYLKDTDVIQVYSGSSWVVKSGGSSPLTTKGDLYTYSTTDARLPVGANGTTLVADSSTATGLKWDTPAAGGGMTLISTTTLSGATTTLSSIPQTYNSLFLIISGVTANTGDEQIRVMLNNSTNAASIAFQYNATNSQTANGRIELSRDYTTRTDDDNAWSLRIDNYTSTTQFKPINYYGRYVAAPPANQTINAGGAFTDVTAITSIVFDYGGTNTFAGGTVLLYGVK